MTLNFSPKITEILEIEGINIQRAEQLEILISLLTLENITEDEFQERVTKIDIEWGEANLVRLKAMKDRHN